MTSQSDDLPVLVIDGANFSDFDGFTREFSRLLCHYTWRGNLDAFNDLLKSLGVSPRDAMQILGHARISVTLEIYTDSDTDSQRDALTKMSERLFGQAGA